MSIRTLQVLGWRGRRIQVFCGFPRWVEGTMLSATPRLQLDTLFVLSERGRIHSTRQPLPSPGPAFMLIRGSTEVAWGVRHDVADELAGEIADLARQEPLSPEWERPPLHARRYQAALRGRVDWGPAFEFPEFVASPDGVVAIHDESLLGRHFSGWVAGEIEAGAAPMMAVLVDGHAVSVCFCARRSIGAAEAGLDTAPAFRGRGLAARVTTSWAGAVRASGRTPLYSTSWTNASSLAVARKLGLRIYATNWSIEG
jgi:GNAT acetyltransferase